jgi:hypothetical protein
VIDKIVVKRNSTGLSPLRIFVSDPNESLRIISQEGVRKGLAVVRSTSPLRFAVRIRDVERSLLKLYVPTRDQIARECAEIRRKWTSAERARRWQGRSAKGRYE